MTKDDNVISGRSASALRQGTTSVVPHSGDIDAASAAEGESNNG
jgi:hypothetical protein